MTILDAPAIDIPVTRDLGWSAHHTWDHDTTHIDGYLTDGRQVDVALTIDPDIKDAVAHPDAHSTWLHGNVHVHTDDYGTPPILVLPFHNVDEILVREAVTRYIYASR